MRAAAGLPLLAPVLLAAAVLGSRLSGNDKAAWLVLAALAGIALLLLAALAALLLVPPWRPKARALLAGCAASLGYAALVLLLARQGWIDALPWLGFR